MILFYFSRIVPSSFACSLIGYYLIKRNFKRSFQLVPFKRVTPSNLLAIKFWLYEFMSSQKESNVYWISLTNERELDMKKLLTSLVLVCLFVAAPVMSFASNPFTDLIQKSTASLKEGTCGLPRTDVSTDTVWCQCYLDTSLSTCELNCHQVSASFCSTCSDSNICNSYVHSTNPASFCTTYPYDLMIPLHVSTAECTTDMNYFKAHCSSIC